MKTFEKNLVKRKLPLSLQPQNAIYGFVAQLDRASDYESEGLRFESLRDHFQNKGSKQNSFEPNFLKIRILNIKYYV